MECALTGSCDSGYAEGFSQTAKSHDDPGVGSADGGPVNEWDGLLLGVLAGKGRFETRPSGYWQAKLLWVHRWHAGVSCVHRRLALMQAEQDFRRRGGLLRSTAEIDSDMLFCTVPQQFSIVTR